MLRDAQQSVTRSRVLGAYLWPLWALCSCEHTNTHTHERKSGKEEEAKIGEAQRKVNIGKF